MKQTAPDTFPTSYHRPQIMLSATTSLKTQIRKLHVSSLRNSLPVARRTMRALPKSPRLLAQTYQVHRTVSSDHSASIHKNALAALARLSKRDPPRQPSKRTPDYETSDNLADRIEQSLEEAGLRTWGFPIYRCTYQSDSDWAEFLVRYRWHISDSLKFWNGLDMLDSFQTTVFQDQALFEGASTAIIREHFQKWATTAIQQEGGSLDMIGSWNFQVPRHQFCLFVDEESLQSVLQAPIEDCINKHAFVNMLKGWWKPESIEDYSQDDLDDGDRLEDLVDDGYDPIEGYTVKDVGWMKVALCDAGLEGFEKLGEGFEWDRVYERPQKICYNISNFHARR